MKRVVLMALGVASLAMVASAAPIVLPVTGGTATGSGYENIPPFFDAQPASVPVAGATTDNFGVAGGFYINDGRAAYFDFGEDWANTTITGVWFGLKLNGTNPNGIAPLCFWSNDIGRTYDPPADILAPDFGMWSWTAAMASKSWQQVFSGSVTPEARYYLMAFNGTQNMGNRLQEIVFVGEVIPEPATMSLLGLGAVALLKRRK